jgi:hypothetical protein
MHVFSTYHKDYSIYLTKDLQDVYVLLAYNLRTACAYARKHKLVHMVAYVVATRSGNYPIGTRLSQSANWNRHWSYSRQQHQKSSITLLRRLDNISTLFNPVRGWD